MTYLMSELKSMGVSELGIKMREFRRLRRLRQVDLAKNLGISVDIVRKLEVGKKHPDEQMRASIEAQLELIA